MGVIDRIPNAQSPKGRRFSEVRRLNYEEEARLGAQAISEYIEPAAGGKPEIPTTEAASDAKSNVVRVLGYERVTLIFEVVAQGSVTGLRVQPEAGWGHQTKQFFGDVYEDEANDGVLVKKVYELTVGAAGVFAVTIPTSGKYMRFKVWATGAAAGSEINVLAIRHMDAC